LIVALSDYAKLLEQLLSTEVYDVSTWQPQSVEELRKALEDKDKVIEQKDKIIEAQGERLDNKDKHIQALRKENEELKSALLLATKK